MNLLSVMLMILFPLSPALRLCEFVRWFIGRVALGLEDPDYVAELKEGGEELRKLHHWLCDMEGFAHIVICYFARDRLGLPFLDHRRFNTGIRAGARLGKPLTFEEVFSRFQRIVGMLSNMEHLVRRRAQRMARKIEANPLGLADHRPSTTTTTIFAAPAFDDDDSTELTDFDDDDDDDDFSALPSDIDDFRARGPPWLSPTAHCRLPTPSLAPRATTRTHALCLTPPPLAPT